MEKKGNYILVQNLESVGWADVYLSVYAPEAHPQKVGYYFDLKPVFPLYQPEFVHTWSELIHTLRKELTDPIVTLPSDFSFEPDLPFLFFDMIHGKTLKDIILQAHEMFLFMPIDHGLLIMNQIHAGLAFLHNLQYNDKRIFHGTLMPQLIYVTYEGEVKLLYPGFMRALEEVKVWPADLIEILRPYLAPEQFHNSIGSKKSDVYSVALLDIQILRNELLQEQVEDAASWLDESYYYSREGSREPLPDDIKALFAGALEQDPEKRLRKIELLKDPLDEKTFSGEFEGSTFNLAFYINQLFPNALEETESFTKMLLEQDYSPLFVEELPQEEELSETLEEFTELEATEEELVEDVIELEASDDVVEEPQMPDITEKDLYPAITPRKKTSPLPVIGGIIALVVIGVGFYLFMRPKPQPSPPPQPPVQQQETTSKEIEFLKQQLEQQKQLISQLTEQLKAAQEKTDQPSEEIQKLLQTIEGLKKQQEELQKKLKEKQSRTQQILAKKTEPKSETQVEAPPQVPEKAESPEAQQPPKNARNGMPQQTEPVERTAETLPEKSTPPETPHEATTQSNATASPKPPETPLSPAEEKPPAEQPPTPPPVKETTSPPKPALPQVILEAQTDQKKIKYIGRCKPAYPPLLRPTRLKGIVIAQITIDKKGHVKHVKILRSKHKLMSNSVIETLKKCKFTPATVNGQPVEATFTRTFQFKP